MIVLEVGSDKNNCVDCKGTGKVGKSDYDFGATLQKALDGKPYELRQAGERCPTCKGTGRAKKRQPN